MPRHTMKLRQSRTAPAAKEVLTKRPRRGRPTVGLGAIVEEWEREQSQMDLATYRLTAAFTILGQAVENDFRHLARSKFGIGTGDLRVLLALRRAGPPYARRATDIFRSLLVTSGAVTKQVDRLVKSGHVERIAMAGDGRGSLIHLTPLGMRVANAAIEAIFAPEFRIASALFSLSQRERKSSEALLGRIVALVEAHDRDAVPRRVSGSDI